MRSKLNLNGSTNGRVANRLGSSSLPHLPLPTVPMSSMPLEWLDAGSWRLPSGKALAEFALQAGFLAPLLLKTNRFADRRPSLDSRRAVHQALEGNTKSAHKGNAR